MECWRHPGVAATGVCVSCGRAGCRECLTLDGRALKCPDCATGGAPPPDQRAAPPPASPRRDRRNLVSWILAAAFGLTGALTATLDPTFPKTPAPLLAFLVAFYAYFGWATAWTFPPVWRWLKQRTLDPVLRRLRQDYRSFALGPLSVLGPLIVLLAEAVLLCFVSIAALFAGMLYGAFGGGIREYLLWRGRLRTEGADAAARRTP
jgi:hypothetical protein